MCPCSMKIRKGDPVCGPTVDSKLRDRLTRLQRLLTYIQYMGEESGLRSQHNGT
jgi:hypothetical protein